MTFEEVAVEAARGANEAVAFAMNQYAAGNVIDEDDLTGFLLGALSSQLSGKIGGISWQTKIFRHRRGIAAEEKRFGADLFIHVDFKSNSHTYAKGVLVQSKRIERGASMSTE